MWLYLNKNTSVSGGPRPCIPWLRPWAPLIDLRGVLFPRSLIPSGPCFINPISAPDMRLSFCPLWAQCQTLQHRLLQDAVMRAVVDEMPRHAPWNSETLTHSLLTQSGRHTRGTYCTWTCVWLVWRSVDCRLQWIVGDSKMSTNVVMKESYFCDQF